MIIRMTVYDNDFTGLIEDFTETLFDTLWDNDWLRQHIFFPCDKNELKDNKTANDSKIFIRDKWNNFVIKQGYSEDTCQYLQEEFELSFGNVYEEKWENNEVVYYFTLNQHIITQ